MGYSRIAMAENRVVGTRETLKALENGRVEALFLASDADDYVLREVRQKAADCEVEIVEVDSMERLGDECNIEVGAAVAAVLKSE